MPMNYRSAQPKAPRWVWEHDPEKYAYENYHKMANTIKEGIPFDQVDTVPPNYHPGYLYQPWSIDQIMEDARNGKTVVLGDGDWDWF